MTDEEMHELFDGESWLYFDTYRRAVDEFSLDQLLAKLAARNLKEREVSSND